MRETNFSVRAFLAGLLLCFLTSAAAGEAPAKDFVISNFEDAAELGKLEGSGQDVKLSIEPRTVTETNKMLKYVVQGGQYPSFTFYPPKAIPKDWSPYEALSFVIWSPADTAISLRIDDDKSINYNTRYNGGFNIQKGRSLLQVPIKDLAKSINSKAIKTLMFFTCDPPKGLTLYFDDLMLGPLQTAKVDFIPYEQRYDLISSLEAVSPHFPLARPLAGGPVRAFMLTSVAYGREVVEMMQRLDLKVSQLSWDREWGCNTWGFGDFYGLRGQFTDFVLMQKYLDSSMQGPEQFDALVLYTPLGWNRFSASAREMILKRVKERGEGLLLYFPFPGEKGIAWPDDLKELSALINSQSDWMDEGGGMKYPTEGRTWEKKWVKTKEHPITNGVPLEVLPFAGTEVQQYQAAPGAEVLLATESGEPVLAVKQVGKGRVVTIGARSHSLTPLFRAPEDYPKKLPYRFWEAWYSLANRALLWAAKREFTRVGEPVILQASGQNKDDYFTVRQWKNPKGEITDWELIFNPLNKDVKRLDVKAPAALNPGEKLTVTFSPAAGLEGAQWTALLGEITNQRWRTLERLPLDLKALVKDGACAVELPTQRVRAYMAYVRIEARQDGKLAAEGRAEVVVTPPNVWDDYEIHTWLESGLPFLQDFEQQRMRDFGLTCNTVGPDDFATMKRLFRGGMRVHGCGLTNGLHAKTIDQDAKEYEATKDKKFLVRKPSYADAVFVAQERKAAGSHAEKMAPYAPLSFIMSDETSLTSYLREFDYDFHPANVAAFREKLKARFGDVAALNAAFKTNVASFDTLEPPTTAEARAAGNWGLWNAWRAHNDDLWTGAFKMYADALKEKYPQAHLSVSGTQEQHIFNGIDWAKLTPVFGAICGYGGRFQEVQRLSFHPGGLKVTPWFAYGRNGRAVDHQVWSSLTTGGCGVGLFWWYSLRNADLTFCKSGKDYQRVLREIKAGVGKQYMLAQRKFSPIAVVWSATSQRAAWALGQMQQFVETEKKVVTALQSAGFDPFFVSEDAVAAGELQKRGVKAVFLPMTIAQGRGEKKGGLAFRPALEEYSKQGGVVVETHAASQDEFLQPIEENKSGFLEFSDVVKGHFAALVGHDDISPFVGVWASNGMISERGTATVHALGKKGFLLTLLRQPVGRKDEVGADGVIRSVPDPASGPEVETWTCDVSGFPGAHFFDSRFGKELTPQNGKITLEMQAGEGRPIAILPYAKPELACTQAVQDRMLVVKWSLKAPGAAGYAPHVVRVEVYDADAKGAAPLFTANTVASESGTGEASFPLALEDENRRFLVRLRDVLTGVVQE